MQVPGDRPGGKTSGWRRRKLLLPVLLFATASGAHGARNPQPSLRLKLADLGVPTPPQYLQGAGASMLTAHYVDATHLLVTYSLRGLVERIPDDPPGDEDRAVAGILVELPSGRVLARTRWHLHDYGQYLWSLGGGRFLLRSRSTLTAIAPLANLASGEPFRAMPFMRVPGLLDYVQVAPEGDLMTVQSSPPRKRPAPPAPVVAGAIDVPPPPVIKEPPPPSTLYFIRISGTGAADSPIRAVAAGGVKVTGGGSVPLNARGYLFARSGKRSRWSLQFESYDGEVRDLSYVDSSCAPRLQFVSPSQFLTFTCRGSDDKLMLSAFDFMPKEMWEEPLAGDSLVTQFAFAASSGRFAISRQVPIASAPPSPGTPGEIASSQEVRVYQMESGDLLMRMVCTPASTTGQNFDLTPDGLNLLMVRDGAIEMYSLPKPSARDQKELAEVQRVEPGMPHETRVQLRHLLKDAVEAEERAEQAAEKKEEEAAKPLPPAPPVSAPANAAANAGDVDTPRKPPSLLNPGETVEGKKPQ